MQMHELPVVLVDRDRMPKAPDPDLERLIREEEEIEMRQRIGGEIHKAGYESACKDFDARLLLLVKWLAANEVKLQPLQTFAVIKEVMQVSQ
jgi:hypothetical protein